MAIEGISDQRIATLLKQRGIDGPLDADDLDVFKNLGVTEAVIKAIGTAPVHAETGDPKANALKHAQQAERDSRAHLRTDPSSVHLREVLALALSVQGKNAEAGGILEQVERDLRARLERDPQNESLREELSYALDLEGKGPRSLALRIAANQASAVSCLRTLNTSAIIYSSDYNHGYPASLSAFGPPSGQGASPDASAAGLIDEKLASGTKSGYVFTYSPGEKDDRGSVNTYSIHADPITPGTTGVFHYFTDQTGLIRQEHDRPANEQSPYISRE
jgi:hypothetical protein